ncbi:unnamed protein product [Schistosoma curassoni]|uniref:G-protein coupled receptors family 1 profile domain-containing protein n=1 Tax=Schistosoma curassoni TaxID=6186 RepID=A0A3P8IXQ2_9TREM|nr:unnamed protein product [Schistosoma curassoni]
MTFSKFSIGLPFELQTVLDKSYPWRLGTVFCRFRIFLTELCPLVSILILTIFSVERYLSICHPFRRILRFSQYDTGHPCNRTSYMHNVNSKASHSSERISKVMNSQMRNSTQIHCSNGQPHYKRGHTPYMVQINALKSCFLLIFCVWIIGSCCAIVIAGLSKVFYAVNLPTIDAFINNTCTDHYHTTVIQFYLTPDCLLNSEMWTPGEALPDSAVCAPSNDSKWAAYLSIPVVLQLWTFLFFFTPMVIMSVLYGLMAIQLSHSNLGLRAQSKSKHGKGKSSSCSISKTRSSGNCRRGIVRMLGFLYYMSATVNPILYSLMSARFRRAFISTFRIKQTRAEDVSYIHPIVSVRIVKINKREQNICSLKDDKQSTIQ